MDFSREFGLTPNIIEKDYLLGWILAGISEHGELGADWMFKDGTCLKKCYFETYRFSEDLDFTIKNADYYNQEFFLNAFKEVADWVYEKAGIEIPGDLTFQLHWTDLTRTLPPPWNAGFIGIEWVTEDFTKCEAQQRPRTHIFTLQRYRSKAYCSVPARSVITMFLQQ